MAYTSIDDPTKYFNIKTYTGNLIERAVEGLGHKPDFLWFKNLDTTNSHNILDSLRGVTKKLEGTDRENAEGDTSTRLTSFDSDGFTVKTDPSVNGQTNQMCVWSWACNGGTNENAVSESGNNPANTRQTNTDAGFSMIITTGTGAAGTVAAIEKKVGKYEWRTGADGDAAVRTLKSFITPKALKTLADFKSDQLGYNTVYKEELTK